MAGRDLYNGVLLLNKPSGISSHDAVLRLRNILKQQGIGHTGTLDPLAEGLLIICLGRATKIAQYISEQDKIYEAEVHLGIRSTTYDAEGADFSKTPTPIPDLSDDRLNSLLMKFIGEITQQVPAFSAVKIDGKPLYTRARRGETFELPERQVQIYDIKLLAFEKPLLTIAVTCTRGTYIRTLADDIGREIGCGAFLSSLRRTAVGKFRLAEALTLEDVDRYIKLNKFEPHLQSIENVLDYSAIKITDDFSRFVINGRYLNWQDVTGFEGRFSAGDRVLLKDSRGAALAIGIAGVGSDEFETRKDNQLFNYIRVLN
ncbi:MAG: tRNA pseudouridine(55) synthase TruB [Candidatus Zixiibacteriota bacterium]